MKKKLFVTISTMLLSAVMTINAAAAYGYIQDEQGWKYQYNQTQAAESPNTGWIIDINGNWRFTNQWGLVEQSVLPINGKLYLFDANGYMHTGWYNGSTGFINPVTGTRSSSYQLNNSKSFEDWWSYFHADGSGAVGWNLIDGKWYYFYEDSTMMTNSTTPDGYWIGADGVWDPTAQNEANHTSDNEVSGNQSNDEMLDELLERINNYRSSKGLHELEVDDELMDFAAERAEELKESFSHNRPDGASITEWGLGENILYGARTAEEAFTIWKNSDGHRRNMLRERYDSIGVGYYQGNSGAGYWVTLFR